MSNLYGYSDYNGPDMKIIDTISCQQDEELLIEQQEFNKEKHHHYQTPYDTDNDNDNENDVDNSKCSNDKMNEYYCDDNPLQTGFWMDGDSLAPPCGTSISTIHKLLEIAFNMDNIKENNNNDNNKNNDIKNSCLYDLGCGDGRICLEAYAKYKCPCTIGIEIENDLVERANYLISKLPSQSIIDDSITTLGIKSQLPRIIQMDLRQVLDQLIKQTKSLTTIANKKNDVIKIESDNTSNTDDISLSDNLPIPTIIILYLLPEALAEIKSRLLDLLMRLPNLRIVCNTWGLPNVRPHVEEEIIEENGVVTSVFIYTKDSIEQVPSKSTDT